MAVNKYDAHTSFMQDTVARFGEHRAEAFSKLNDNQDRSYLEERKKEVDEAALKKLSQRDKERAKSDPTFQPKDDDFTQPVSYKYNPQINYYKVLGIEETATQEEVKKAYRKLSLVYHPDKTRDLPQEEKDEHAEVFIELKNAYKLLADNPTRRQYDYERDRTVAKSELRGKPAPKDEAAFEAAVALAKLAEKFNREPRKPGNVVTVQLQCKLEKFVHGGHKAVERTRQVKQRFSNPPEFYTESKLYRIHVPPGSEPPFNMEFSKQGDQHADREPDTLKFVISAKPHDLVRQEGLDLHLTERMELGEGWHKEPYFSAEVPTVRGRHELLWGRNPFFHSAGADFGELRVAIAGEGLGKGSFSLRARMGMKNAPAPTMKGGRVKAVSSGALASPSHREFLERFRLLPSWGPAPGLKQDGDAMEAPSLQRRLRRLSAQAAHTCDVELTAVGEPVILATKPFCILAFYSNPRPSSEGRLQPFSVFAISMTSPPCGRKAASKDWTRLRASLTPLLQASGFRIWALARRELPRALSCRSAFPDWACLQPEETGGLAPNALWKSLGDQALLAGNLWQAVVHYSRRLKDWDNRAAAAAEAAELLGEEEAATDWAEDGEQSVIAKVLSNRSCCLARLGDYEGALADARRARDMAPRWARPWSRLGLAAWQLGGEGREEALAAYRKAVELEASEAEMARLFKAASLSEEPNPEAAHSSKEEGALALQHHEPGQAIACYTVALARLPPVPEGTKADEDPHALLRAVLLTNRSISLAWLGLWEAAAVDGRAAIATKPDFQKARCQLGVALLGCGHNEQAYAEFATAIHLEEEQENQRAQKGRKACLLELQRWNSSVAKSRYTRRFGLDFGRPWGSTRVFAISDVFFGKKCNEDWAHAIDSFAFQEDVLIIAGGISEALGGIVKALTAFKTKFRRVFFTPGGLELSIHRSEANKFADSLAKLYAIYEACDSLGVDVVPAPVCSGLYVVPMLSWYNAAYDEKDPFPNPNLRFDAGCRWPIDADEQLWKYMIKLNEPGRLRGACLQCACCPGWTTDGQSAGQDGNPKEQTANICSRCGCHDSAHEDVTARFACFAQRGIPLEALGWTQLEFDLWRDTDGLFRPGKPLRATRPSTGDAEPLVSVICPTTGSRRCFHQCLFVCFNIQSHKRAELVIVETSEEEPSEFFLKKMRDDPRVIYHHYAVPERKWSIGLKRNLACYLSVGTVIAHFDDDDMYGEDYLESMVKYLRNPKSAFDLAHLHDQNLLPRLWGSMGLREMPVDDALAHAKAQAGLGKFGAACAKLSCWRTYTLKSRSFRLVNACEEDDKELFGWGFSFVYLRSVWLSCPFAHMGLGEDFDFVHRLQLMGYPVVLVHDQHGMCAHTTHMDNTSGGNPKSPRRFASSAQLYSSVARLLGMYEKAAERQQGVPSLRQV